MVLGIEMIGWISNLHIILPVSEQSFNQAHKLKRKPVDGKGMKCVTADTVIALTLLLLTAVLGIRYAIRAKCLGCCAHCPRADACAAKRERAVGENAAQTAENLEKA